MLPTEIQLLVLKSFKVEDILANMNILTVCRLWYNEAQPKLYKEMRITDKNIDKSPPIEEHSYQKLQTHLLRLDFRVYHSYRHYFSMVTSPSYPGLNDQMDWLSCRLNMLAKFLKGCERNRILCLRVDHDLLDDFFQNFSTVLSRLDAIARILLSPGQNLTELVVHAFERSKEVLNGETLGQLHKCPIIAHHLPMLRVLKVCLGSICTGIVDFRKKDVIFDRLQIIEIRLNDTCGDCAYHCMEPFKSFSELRRSIIRLTKGVVKRSESIKTAMVIWHRFEDGVLQAKCCISDKIYSKNLELPYIHSNRPLYRTILE